MIQTGATASRLKTATMAGRSLVLGATSRRRCLSSSALERYGLGGHHWKRFDPSSYSELIYQALAKEVSLLEVSGQEGGEIAMVGAIQGAIERSPEVLDTKKRSLTVTTRIGYRGQELKQNEQEDNVESRDITKLAGDVVATEEGSESVIHNVSADFILETMKASPLLELKDELNIKIAFLIHNPEVQVLELLKNDPNASFEDRQVYIQQRWQPALEKMQEYTSGEGGGISFGVVSNGLGIPSEQNHPMHLGVDLVIDAAKQYDQFTTVQLPANLLENYGWEMARKLHSEVPPLDVMAIRPLTCYPDLGTGTGHPFRLVDYNLPSLHENPLGPFEAQSSSSSSTVQYTNEMTGAPTIYQVALQTAMSHFDAEELLEIKQSRDLMMEERETLDGCKLVQSMIHDLDADLEHIRSFAAHEDELYSRIIPLLYDTFEAMDDRTSEVLSAFFAAYAVAVRYAIAKNTREVLQHGEGAGGSSMTSTVTYPDIPKSMTLQEYSLRHLLADKTFSRVIIGASTMQDFSHQTQLMEEIGDSPLDAISKANESEQ